MPEPGLEVIGQVATFYLKASAASIRLTAPLTAGDTVYIRGATTDFWQDVHSLQIDHIPVQEARAGQLVGVRVTQRCRKHDVVYRVSAREPGRPGKV